MNETSVRLLYRLVGGPRHGEMLTIERSPVVMFAEPPVASWLSDDSDVVEFKRTTYSVQKFALSDPAWIDPAEEGGGDQEKPERRMTRLLLWDGLSFDAPEATDLAVDVLSGRADPRAWRWESRVAFAWDVLADQSDPHAQRHVWDHQLHRYLLMERIQPTDADWPGWRDPRPIDARRIPDPEEDVATRTAKDLAEGLANSRRRPHWPGPM